MWRFTMEQVANGEVGFRAFEGDNYFENTTDTFIYHATDGRSMTSEQKVNVDIFVSFPLVNAISLLKHFDRTQLTVNTGL